MLHRPRSRLLAAVVFAFALMAPLHVVCAQEVLDAKSAVHLRDEYVRDLDTLHSKIMALANAIPDDKYAWRPMAGVRSISEALMHVSAEWYYWAPMSVGGRAPVDFGPPRAAAERLNGITKKSAVIAELDKSWSHCRAQLMSVDAAHMTAAYKPWGMPLDAAAFAMTGDLHEHLGQLIAYARSVGVKPPWTR